MTGQGTLIIDLAAIGLMLMIFELVRRRYLFVGWGLIWILPLAGLLVFINVPPLLGWLTWVTGAQFPVSALSLIGFVFLFFTMILLSVQVCTLKSRQIELIQNIGLRELSEDVTGSAGNPAGDKTERKDG